MCKRIMIVDNALRAMFHRLGKHIGISPGKCLNWVFAISYLNKHYMRLLIWYDNFHYNFSYFLGYYIIVPVLLTALFASGFQRITYEADPEYLFSPINGHSKLERQALEKHFPMNYSEFDAGQEKVHRFCINDNTFCCHLYH